MAVKISDKKKHNLVNPWNLRNPLFPSMTIFSSSHMSLVFVSICSAVNWCLFSRVLPITFGRQTQIKKPWVSCLEFNPTLGDTTCKRRIDGATFTYSTDHWALTSYLFIASRPEVSKTKKKTLEQCPKQTPQILHRSAVPLMHVPGKSRAVLKFQFSLPRYQIKIAKCVQVF